MTQITNPSMLRSQLRLAISDELDSWFMSLPNDEVEVITSIDCGDYSDMSSCYHAFKMLPIEDKMLVKIHYDKTENSLMALQCLFPQSNSNRK